MKKIKIIRVVLIIFIVIVYYFVCKEYIEYKESKDMYNISFEYNHEQKNCRQVGATKNYIYVIRVDKYGKPIVGAKWRITDEIGNIIGDFETNNNGNGGLVGLANGKYYAQELSIPKGEEKKLDERYSFIISDIDHTFKIDTRSTSIIIFTNDKEGNPVKGIQYHILNENKENVITVTSNSKGRAGVGNLGTGKYFIQEDGKEPIEVNLLKGEVHIENIIYGTEEE